MTEVLAGFLPLLILGGLVFAIVHGLRSVTGDGSEPIEPVEAAKSFALNVGLYVALIACAVGLIDLLQSLVEPNDRLAGTSSDMARGLSLLLVAGPAYALVLRAIGRRSADRTARGDRRAPRGWTVYLVVALATTLIAVLVSVGLVADDLTNAGRGVEAAEVVQLVVWLGLWVVHWFALRPWLGVRGDAHLAIGTVAGLSWLLSGAGAVVYRVLESGYDATVDTTLDSSVNLGFWLIVGATGGVVWLWHWVAALDAPAPGPAIEGVRRGSPLWFFTAVVAGILPGLVAIVVTATIMVSGVLIWFVGTTDQSAADYFRPAPGLVAALFIGFVTWAYHRWVLEAHRSDSAPGAERDGEETLASDVRNESIRFHDYVAVTIGLMAVVGGAAALVSLAIETIATSASLAGSDRTDNLLIVTLTVLVAGALLWWHYWGIIETARSANPLEESDSFWRKIYLIASFGIGGLVLGVALVWVLFAFLRDLLDGTLGRSTIEDLASPFGWAVAVVGAVWYHFGVWQSDRGVIEANRPVPPPPPTLPSPPHSAGPDRETSAVATAVGLSLRPATRADAGELFTLQLADRAVQGSGPSESMETFAQMRERLDSSEASVITDGHRIIGFVCRSLDPAEPTPIQAVIAPDRNTPEIVGLLASAMPPADPTS